MFVMLHTLSFSEYALWTLNALYGAFLFYDEVIQSLRCAPNLLVLRLKRRVSDMIFLQIIIFAGIGYTFKEKQYGILLALCVLSAFIAYHGLRYPKWRLKEKGFTLGFGYYLYTHIQQMQLLEDGVLLVQLSSGKTLILPFVFIEDLEKAAAFFTDKQFVDALISTTDSKDKPV